MAVVQRLAFARLVSLAGGSAAYIALVAAIYGETGSALWVSAAIFASVVTSVAAAAPAGWLGDRFDRRTVMIVSDLASVVVSLAMAATADDAWALVLLLGASSATQAPFDPASASAIPQVVPERDVPRANSLVAASSSAAYLAGPLLGGALLGLGASPAEVFAADAATFLVSALLVRSVRRPFGRGSTAEHPGLLAGARVIVRERALLVPVLAGMLSLVGIGIVGVASFPLSVELGGGATGFGLMTGLLGGGGLLGAALAARALRAGPVRVLTASFAAGAAGVAIAAGAPVLAVCLVGMAVAGAGRGVGDVAETTLIQARSADAVRSRVFAAQDGAAHVAFSVSAFAGGLLVELLGARGAVGVAAAFGLGAAGVAAAASPRRRASRSSREP